MDIFLESKARENLQPPSNRQKLKKLDELIKEVDHFYENWIEIYYSVFNGKDYSLNDINKAIKEIDKEIEYLENEITNLSKGQ